MFVIISEYKNSYQSTVIIGTSLIFYFSDILSEMNQPKILTTSSYGDLSINSFKCDINTKYYSTSISLIPFDGKLEGVPAEIRKLTEALIIYFDPSDVSTLIMYDFN